MIEREPLPGGLAAGFEIEPGMWLEKFYHHLFRSDHARHRPDRGARPRRSAGLAAPLTATLRDGRIHQLDSPASLLRFSPLPVVDRLRMGAALASLKAMPNPRLLEGQTAADWIRRWMGSAAYDVVWGPLLRGKFGDAAPEIAMPWFWARVHDRTQQLGYLRGGFQRLYDRLAEGVRSAGGETRFGTAVHIGQDRWRRGSRSRPMRAPSDSTAWSGRWRRGSLPAGAGAAAGMARSARMGPGLRRALPGAGARPAADIGLLAERQRSGLPVHGPGRAHQLPAARRLRRAPPGLPGQLPADGRSRC